MEGGVSFCVESIVTVRVLVVAVVLSTRFISALRSSTTGETRKCCPFGPLIAVPICLSLTGLPMLGLAAFNCDYVWISKKYLSGITDTIPNLESDFGMGFWSVEHSDYDGYDYHAVTADGPIWFGRIVGIIGVHLRSISDRRRN